MPRIRACLNRFGEDESGRIAVEYVIAAARILSGAMSPRAERVLARIRDTPEGFVRAYGDVSPGAPRFAGTVLFACDDPDVPWHRIVRADGSLAKGARQRALLEA